MGFIYGIKSEYSRNNGPKSYSLTSWLRDKSALRDRGIEGGRDGGMEGGRQGLRQRWREMHSGLPG